MDHTEIDGWFRVYDYGLKVESKLILGWTPTK